MAADFVPFLPGLRSRLNVPAPNGAAPSPLAMALPASPATPAPSQAKVEVIRSGDRISRLKITCRCGELIEIDCEY